MLVRDVMTGAAVTDSAADTLRSAAERMWREQTGSLLVMDGERLAGIITERGEGTRKFVRLRRDELDNRFPGLLDLVLAD